MALRAVLPKEIKWRQVAAIHGAHRIFIDDTSKQYSIADWSGRFPHETDDGILWIDTSRPIIKDGHTWAIPLLKHNGEQTQTIGNDEEATWMAQNLSMEIVIGTWSAGPFVKIPQKHDVGDLSTAHITQEDSERLGAGLAFNYVGSTEYGWIVRTFPKSDTESEIKLRNVGLSHAFIRLMQIGNSLGYWYLFLDRDGPTVDDLPKFDW